VCGKHAKSWPDVETLSHRGKDALSDVGGRRRR
jgi:hypothetical protein